MYYVSVSEANGLRGGRGQNLLFFFASIITTFIYYIMSTIARKMGGGYNAPPIPPIPTF